MRIVKHLFSKEFVHKSAGRKAVELERDENTFSMLLAVIEASKEKKSNASDLTRLIFGYGDDEVVGDKSEYQKVTRYLNKLHNAGYINPTKEGKGVTFYVVDWDRVVVKFTLYCEYQRIRSSLSAWDEDNEENYMFSQNTFVQKHIQIFFQCIISELALMMYKYGRHIHIEEAFKLLRQRTTLELYKLFEFPRHKETVSGTEYEDHLSKLIDNIQRSTKSYAVNHAEELERGASEVFNSMPDEVFIDEEAVDYYTWLLKVREADDLDFVNQKMNLVANEWQYMFDLVKTKHVNSPLKEGDGWDRNIVNLLNSDSDLHDFYFPD